MEQPAARNLKPASVPALLLGMAFLLYALYTGGFLWRAWQALAYPLALDFGEGFLLAQCLDLHAGRLPYQPLSPERMVVGNYPLFYPALSSLFFFSDELRFAGPRAISILATLGTALLAFLFLRRRGVAPLWCALAPLFYLSTYHVLEWGVLARVDALGLFLSALGLYLFDRNGRLAPALVCFTLAFNTRQTLLAAPLAVGVYLWQQDERGAAVRFLALFATIQAGLIAALSLLSGGEYFRHLFLYNINRIEWQALYLYGQHLARLVGPMLALGLAFLVWHRQERRVELLAPLLLLATLSTLACVKVGSATNYFLEFLWVLSLAGAQFLDELGRQAGRHPILRPLLAALVLLCALQSFHLPGTRWDFLSTRVPMREERVATGRFAHLIQQAESEGRRVLASDASFHVRAGVPPFYHPFIMHELARAGRFDDRALWEQLAAGEIAAVILDFDLERPGASGILFSDALFHQLPTHYRLAESHGRFRLWLPFSPAAAGRHGAPRP